MKLVLKYDGYDESLFWLALSPLTDEQDHIRGFFLELFRCRIDLTWRPGRFD
jgi:hypothetical protein